MATMNDVAKAAGVSLTTVSHVLNGTRKVNAVTEQAVREAIERVAYIPNSLARSLAKASSNTIGVAMSALSNHYFAETLHAIETECARTGLMTIFADTHDDPEQEFKAVIALHQRRVDGILLAPFDADQSKTMAYLAANELPTVLVDRMSGTSFDYVGVENIHSMHRLVEHLLRLGHRRIGFISGKLGLTTSGERLQGYTAALTEAGLPHDPVLVQCGESAVEPAMAATARLLDAAQPPTAIISSNNLMTVGALRLLRQRQLILPTDIAFCGFDDFDWADLTHPGLTLMAQPIQQIGAIAVRLLRQRIEQPSSAPQLLRLNPQLCIRGSCGAPHLNTG